MTSTMRVRKHRYLKKLEKSRVNFVCNNTSKSNTEAELEKSDLNFTFSNTSTQKFLNTGLGNSLSSAPEGTKPDVCKRCESLVWEIKNMRQEMSERFERMERALVVIAGEKNNLVFSNATVDIVLPLQSIQDVGEVETKLKNLEFKKQLEQKLFLVGGQDVHRNIYNIFKNLLSPQLTKEYTAFGKRGKLSFTALSLYEVVKNVIRRRFQDATDQEILKSLIKFFVSAKDRIKKK